jgi:hypothetical protein
MSKSYNIKINKEIMKKKHEKDQLIEQIVQEQYLSWLQEKREYEESQD